MKQIYLIISGLFFMAFAAKAQDKEVFQPGYAILKDGTRISGLISVYDTAPWYNQRFIYVKDSAAVAAKPDGNVPSKKYVADDLKSYKAGDKTYTKVHYVDYDNLQLKSLGSNDHMLEVLAAGRINAYRFYAYPKDVYLDFGSADDVKQRIKKDKNELLSNWKMLTEKDKNGKLNDAYDYDLQKYFEDTPAVLEKYRNGAYGNEPVSTKKGLAARMISMARKKVYNHINWESLVAAFSDYNQVNAAIK
jgi:hypothetical protein